MFRIVKISQYASYDIGSSFQLNDHDMTENYDNPFADTTPKIVALTYCCRKSGYYIFNAFFLIFLITVLSLVIFSIDCKLVQNRIQTTCTLLLTSVTFKWTVNRYLPCVCII